MAIKKQKSSSKVNFKTGVVKDRYDKKRKIRIRFDKIMLRLFIGYLCIDSKFITRANYICMSKLFDIIDTSIYETDEEMYDMITFIHSLLSARLEKGMSNLNVILSYCLKNNNTGYEKIVANIDLYTKIKPDEIKYINKAVQDRLKYAFIVFYKDIMYEEFEKIDTGEFASYEEVTLGVKEVITRLTAEMRSAESLVSLDTFSLKEGIFESVVTDIVNKLKDPSRKLVTGIKALNKILSPGFISGRLYMFLGLTGFSKPGIRVIVYRNSFNCGEILVRL